MIVKYSGGTIKVDSEVTGFSPAELLNPRIRLAILGVTTVYLTISEVTELIEAITVVLKEARVGN